MMGLLFTIYLDSFNCECDNPDCPNEGWLSTYPRLQPDMSYPPFINEGWGVKVDKYGNVTKMYCPACATEAHIAIASQAKLRKGYATYAAYEQHLREQKEKGDE